MADPLGLIDGASIYGYAIQNPPSFIDPTGEALPIIAIAAVIGAVAAALDVYHEACQTEDGLTYEEMAFGIMLNRLTLGLGKHAMRGVDAVLTMVQRHADEERALGRAADNATNSEPTRPLTANDSGTTGQLDELTGTFSIQNGVANVRIDMVEGKSLTN